MEKGGCERNVLVAFSYAVPRAVGENAGFRLRIVAEEAAVRAFLGSFVVILRVFR